MSKPMMSPAEARAALDSTAAARAHIAAVGLCPPWRHAAFGGVMALLVGGLGFPIVIQMGCTAVALVGIAIIASYDRRRYGMFVNGYRRGATRPVVAALLLSMMALMALQIYFREHEHAPWVPFVIGLAGFVVAVIGSVCWARAFRREMERGA